MADLKLSSLAKVFVEYAGPAVITAAIVYPLTQGILEAYDAYYNDDEKVITQGPCWYDHSLDKRVCLL